ncbi:MAG: DNA polymerase III subunit alpha [Anaerolineae bacterium]|nr:DNA polymerase III subunit alpha [Anaerolineae bacterium]
MGETFVHLHVHSEFSLLDGLPSVKAIAEHCASMGQQAIALTDHGVMFGAIEFYEACRRANVKPIAGMEAYLARRGRSDRDPHLDADAFHLLLLAENDEGYHNLLRLATAAQLEGFYRHPRVDKALLAEHSSGLICTSGCLAAEIPDLLRAGRVSEATAALDWYREIFAERFYLELQQHEGLKELDPINRQLVQWSEQLGLPLIVTCDAHYLRAEDAEAHDALLCVQTGKTLDDPKRLRMTSRDYYLRSAEEMSTLWREVPRALANTLEIAERCNVDLSFKGYHLPRFEVPQGHTPERYLRAMCEEGIARCYDLITDTVRQRMEYELSVIHKMGFDTYFLIVWDLIRYARENNIWFNVRGSAASSIVAYALGITSLEPLSNHLIFERFLNPDRVSMPDIDLDFPDDKRGRILNYAVTRYGKENVAQIVTFGRMLAKAAVRDVGRVLGYSIPEVNRVAKLIPNAPGQTLSDALEQSSELNTLYESDPRAKQLIDMARPLQGVARTVSTHPAGVIIADRPIVEYAPLHRATNGKDESVPITQYDMNDLERIGLLKIDLLGLATLSVMRNVCAIVQERYGVALDLSNIPLDDVEAFALLARGNVLGIFQVESQGLRDVLVQMKPTRFEHIVAAIALYRPGPLQYIPTYIKRMHGQEPVEFLHPSLEPILAETYAILIFQEQLMRIARDCCGFTGAEADTLRKAVSKKNKEQLLAQRERFVRGAIAIAGMTDPIANKLFDDIEYFARYGFPRAHAANYAALTCQTAYLKAHYPLEYMWALLNNEAGDFEKLVLLVSEARRAGIEVLAPDVRYSGVEFSIESDLRAVRGERSAVRYGLGAIKNVGEGAAQTIVAAQRKGEPFASLADFCQRIALKQVNRRALEFLIASGALDGLGERAALFKSVERLIASSTAAAAARENGQMSLFGGAAEAFASVELSDTPPMPASEKAERERELLGVAFSEDVMEQLRVAMRERKGKVLSSAALADCNEKSGLVATAGVIKSVRKTKTKKGESMAFVQIEDDEGDVELVLFPRVYIHASSLLCKGIAVIVEGRVQLRDDKISFLVERMQAFFENEAQLEGDAMRRCEEPPDGGDDKTSTIGESGDSICAEKAAKCITDAEAASAIGITAKEFSVHEAHSLSPTRRVGRVQMGKAAAVSPFVPSAPPLRRTASVFGTRGSEIVTHPLPLAATSRQPISVAVEKQGESELKTASDEIDAQEPSPESSTGGAGRRIYIHFREVPPERGAAYVQPLFTLFNAYSGRDEVALLFERSNGLIKIGAPYGVDYDTITDAVVDIIGEDAVVEIL